MAERKFGKFVLEQAEANLNKFVRLWLFGHTSAFLSSDAVKVIDIKRESNAIKVQKQNDGAEFYIDADAVMAISSNRT